MTAGKLVGQPSAVEEDLARSAAQLRALRDDLVRRKAGPREWTAYRQARLALLTVAAIVQGTPEAWAVVEEAQQQLRVVEPCVLEPIAS